jgi:DNA-directed RNA polymerase specialized sigma24 family protein
MFSTKSNTMNDYSLGSISQLFQLLQQGNSQSATEIFARYFPRLLKLAQRVLAARTLPMEAEDAVQDAFLQFFNSVQLGTYDQPLRRDDLWRILSMITVQQSRKQLGREATAKRGGGRVRLESQMVSAGSGTFRLDAQLGSLSTAECDLIFTEMLEQLGDELREVAILRLAGYTNPEIKVLLNSSLRSIERRVQIVRATWKEYLKA